MSVSYTAVGWTRHKRAYDTIVAGAAAAFLGVFVVAGMFRAGPDGPLTVETLLIRALGMCALTMLHIVLWIGPLARLDRRLLPLLFNRRHLGVATFLVALAHATFSLLQYHALGNTNPLVSLLTSNTAYYSLRRFPFETLGLGGLAILFIMAATSHDFWLKNLSARVWKNLHMLVYPCYALVVLHVALGFLIGEASSGLFALLTVGVVLTAALHLDSGLRERTVDAGTAAGSAGLVDACAVDEIPEGRAKVVRLARNADGIGERIAIFRHGDSVSAVTNVCAHQGGPVGEGKIIDGCITCPWHGWQYRPVDGRSPPPFTEKIATHRVQVSEGRVLVDPVPLPPGTPTVPAPVAPVAQADDDDGLFVGYLPGSPPATARRSRVGALCLVTMALAVSAAVSLLQRPAGSGTWDSQVRSRVGLFVASPYPMLRFVEGADPVSESITTALLVGPGKCGVWESLSGACGPGAASDAGRDVGGDARQALTSRYDSRLVRVVGSTLRREGSMMIELAPGQTSLVLETENGELLARLSAAIDATGSAEPVTLVGEVVDPKCYFGAMKPGKGKTHLDCAVRCISGGVPPVLAVHGSAADRVVVLTIGGEPANGAVLPFVGDVVEVRGVFGRRAGIATLDLLGDPVRR